MTAERIRKVGAVCLLVLWFAITGFAWFSEAKQTSEAERRPLAQMPALSVDALLSGSFMGKFEQATLDQFPLRDSFRGLKAMFHYYALNQSDNNDIYLAQDHAGKLLYPLDTEAVSLAMERLNRVYDRYLKDTKSQIYVSVIPDKSYWLSDLVIDYEAMFSMVEQAMPWATYIPLTDVLTIDDFYRTDIHWRQENLLPAAQKLAQGMEAAVPEAEDFTAVSVDRPFYGVYHGQAALPMKPETMVLMQSMETETCTVYDHETGKTTSVYDLDKSDSRDLYDVFLSGSKSLLTIENPNAQTDKELIVFRDSFASSLIPLLLKGYAKVTLVDIRYMSSEILGNFIDFTGQDVLFLYSTTVLNTKGILR